MSSQAMNPKDALSSGKLPLHLFPPAAVAQGCLALLTGALKYGPLNWRSQGARATLYIDAVYRHLNAWMEGEDEAEDTGVHHLAHAIGRLAILIDTMEKGNLTDDRNCKNGYLNLVKCLTPEVTRLKKQFADTIPDGQAVEEGGDTL